MINNIKKYVQNVIQHVIHPNCKLKIIVDKHDDNSGILYIHLIKLTKKQKDKLPKKLQSKKFYSWVKSPVIPLDLHFERHTKAINDLMKESVKNVNFPTCCYKTFNTKNTIVKFTICKWNGNNWNIKSFTCRSKISAKNY
jgi:hypothetical protein